MSGLAAFVGEGGEDFIHSVGAGGDVVAIFGDGEHRGLQVFFHAHVGEDGCAASHLHDALLEAEFGRDEGHRPSVQAHHASVGDAEAAHGPQQGGLACAVRAEQG